VRLGLGRGAAVATHELAAAMASPLSASACMVGKKEKSGREWRGSSASASV
jgi:hypothetical protein